MKKVYSSNPYQLSLIILKQNSLVLQPTLRPEVGKPVSSFRASPQASDKNNSSKFLSNNPPASQFSDIPPTLGDIPEVLRSSCRLQTHVNVCEKPSGKVSSVSSYSVVSMWQSEIRPFASAAAFLQLPRTNHNRRSISLDEVIKHRTYVYVLHRTDFNEHLLKTQPLVLAKMIEH